MKANDPWALHAAFFSIIIKVEAINRSYPGGKDHFLTKYQPHSGNGALCSLLAMSMQDVDYILAELNEYALVPGVDIGVGDMVHGPILPCPGIRFEPDDTSFPPTWWVNVETGPVAPQLSSDPSVQTHTVRIAYTFGICAHHGDNDPIGEHTITVDGATFALIRAGSFVRVEGQGIKEEDGVQHSGDWLFNDPEGTAALVLDDGEHFEATDMWLDGVLMSRPVPSY